RVHEDVTHFLRPERNAVPDEPPLREQRKAAGEGGEGEGEEEEFQKQPAERRAPEILQIGSPVEDAQALAAGRDWPSKLLRRRCRVRSFGVWRDRGQEKRGPEDAEQGESRRAEDRNLEPEVGREVAGRSGADEKADPERDPDHRERSRPFFWSGHVGDVRLRDGEVPGGQPVDDPREEDDEEIGREREQDRKSTRL